MKNNKLVYITLSVITIIVLFLAVNIIGDNIKIDFSIDTLRKWIDRSEYSKLFFILLWGIRLLAFIPGVTLMLLGGLIFDPSKAFLLSLIGIVLSDTLIFLLAKGNLFKRLKEKVSNKYPDLVKLIDRYNYKILAIGVLCPIAPTDVIVFLSSYMGMSFIRFVMIFIGANIPALFLYSYLGESFEGSIFNTIFIIATLLISGILSIKLWRDLKSTLSNDYSK